MLIGFRLKAADRLPAVVELTGADTELGFLVVAAYEVHSQVGIGAKALPECFVIFIYPKDDNCS